MASILVMKNIPTNASACEMGFENQSTGVALNPSDLAAKTSLASKHRGMKSGAFWTAASLHTVS